MTEIVFFAWVSAVTLVSSNPVPQVFPNQQYTSQQTSFIPSTSIPASYQTTANQNNPYDQYVTTQNQAPVQRNFDGPMINELLMSKILKNPCLQKIMDPNTKLYNQNGQEIQRQPNTAVAPSVVNNYFIVPPEFFNINNNKTEKESTNIPRRRKFGDGKANLIKTVTKSNVFETNKKPEIVNNDTNNKIKKISNHATTGKKKRRQSMKLTKIVQKNNETNIEQSKKDLESGVNITNRKRKQESGNTESIADVAKPNDISEVEVNEKKCDEPRNRKKYSKRRNKLKKDFNIIKKETTDNPQTAGEKIKFASNDQTPKSVPILADRSHLKNIESPVDNNETINLQDNSRYTKQAKENRRTRNPNTAKNKKEPMETIKLNQKLTPISEDILKNFYPYMYMGNNFFSNGNYPFNFEQFYQPFIGNNKKKKKNTKGRKNKNEQSKQEPLPNVVEIKIKQKNHNNNTNEKTPIKKDKKEEILDIIGINTTKSLLGEDNTKDINLESASIIPTTKPDKPITHLEVKELNNENLSDIIKEENPVNKTIKEESTITNKANLEMPPTLIEDLHEYITPELGSEDIVPTIHTNGIINDYYPIFYDDSYYTNDESYYLRDLEDDRHFYTTDRGFEEPLNRDRRKFDIYEDYPRPNLNIKDRINFRRSYKFRERDKPRFNHNDKTNFKRPYPQKVIERENIKENNNLGQESVKLNDTIEDQFKTPPWLEKPDFVTTKVDKVIPPSNTASSYEVHEPIYTNFVEMVPEVTTHFDSKPIQYSRLIHFEDDAKKDGQITKNKPKNDIIETVFAKTRVVKYGVAKDVEENTSFHPLFENDGEDMISDGHTTYVLAKSLSSDDYFW